MTKAQIETALRKQFLDLIINAVSEKMEIDALFVGAGELTVPCVDAEGNETFANITVKIPRGTRNGSGGYDAYDGYAAAEDYKFDLEEKAQKKTAADEKKRKKIEADEKKRAEKKALKEANEGLKELRNIKVAPEKE